MKLLKQARGRKEKINWQIKSNGNKNESISVGIAKESGFQSKEQVQQIQLDNDAIVILRADCMDLSDWEDVLRDKLERAIKDLQS